MMILQIGFMLRLVIVKENEKQKLIADIAKQSVFEWNDAFPNQPCNIVHLSIPVSNSFFKIQSEFVPTVKAMRSELLFLDGFEKCDTKTGNMIKEGLKEVMNKGIYLVYTT